MKRDALFFKNNEIMDYSLLVMKISWGDYFKDHPDADKDIVPINCDL
jgi:hypothetical protein